MLTLTQMTYCPQKGEEHISLGFFFTSRFIFQPLHRHEERLLLVQLTLEEGVSFNRLVQTGLKVFKRNYCSPAHTVRKYFMSITGGTKKKAESILQSTCCTLIILTFSLSPGHRWPVRALGHICEADPWCCASVPGRPPARRSVCNSGHIAAPASPGKHGRWENEKRLRPCR